MKHKTHHKSHHHSDKELMTKSAIMLGMITMISFSIIDSTIFLFGEEEFNDFLKENVEFLDEYTIPIFISGISSAISILIAKMFAHYYLKRKYIVNEHPIIDFIGVLIGMSFVIFIYHFKKMSNK